MDKKIQYLAEQSYKNSILDAKSVILIASYMSRKQLKIYIKTLKKIEQAQTVFVEVPYGKDEIYQSLLNKIFKGKKITIQQNPDLILGIRIRDNDTIYELSLKEALENIYTYVEKNYD